MPRHAVVLIVFLFVLRAGAGFAGDADGERADLRLRIASSDQLRYKWTIDAESETTGRELGQPFTLRQNSRSTMTILMNGMPRAKDAETFPVTITIQDFALNQKLAIGSESKAEPSETFELIASKSALKQLKDGKVVVDSENDIGMEQAGELQQYIKNIEGNPMRAVLDAAGRKTELATDTPLLEGFKNNAHGLFPILAGKEVKPGDAWEDSFSMPKLDQLQLAKPVVVRSKMRFAKWEFKNGRRLALIEIATAAENKELKGESPKGMLAEITKLESIGAGTCLFDPASGQFVEGSVAMNTQYHVDGQQPDGSTTGTDRKEKFTFSFALSEKK
jgi:hypothetical protein